MEFDHTTSYGPSIPRIEYNVLFKNIDILFRLIALIPDYEAYVRAERILIKGYSIDDILESINRVLYEDAQHESSTL